MPIKMLGTRLMSKLKNYETSIYYLRSVIGQY